MFSSKNTETKMMILLEILSRDLSGPTAKIAVRQRARVEFICASFGSNHNLSFSSPLSRFSGIFRMRYELVLTIVLNFWAIRKNMNFGEAWKTKKPQYRLEESGIIQFWVCHSIRNDFPPLESLSPQRRVPNLTQKKNKLKIRPKKTDFFRF